METLLVGVGVLIYLVMPHALGAADGAVRFETTRELIAGRLTASRYSIVQSAFAVPLFLLGELVSSPEHTVALFNTVLFIAGLGALTALLRDHADGAIVRRLVLLLVAASMFPIHAQMFLGEMTTALFVSVGLLCLILHRQATGYTLLLLGAANTPAAVPGVFLALLDWARPRRIWQAIWPVLVVALAVLLEFYLRRGSPIRTGYESHRATPTPAVLPFLDMFQSPMILGIPSILFSFGKGLAFFVPGLWLLFRHTAAPPNDVLRPWLRHSTWCVAGLVLVYSKWHGWSGGDFWGPRFFLLACVPACVAMAMHLDDARASAGAKTLTIAIVVWSLWVGFNAMVFGQWGNEQCLFSDDPRQDRLCLFAPEFSPLLRLFLAEPPMNARKVAVAAYYAAVAGVLAGPFALDLVRRGRARLQARLTRFRAS